MICNQTAKKFCRDDITKIENYEKAIADSKTWHLHHRLETHKYKDRNRTEWTKRDENVSKETLLAFDLYYNRPAAELIFLTAAEHINLHCKNREFSEETRLKMSKAKKGKSISEEHKRKIGEARKGIKLSNETKQKMSAAKKGNKNCLGYRHSEEAKQKIKEAWKRRKALKIER